MSLWYVHPLTTVYIVRGQDPQLFKYAKDEATGALVRTAEPNPRDGRGWPVYEERMATLGLKTRSAFFFSLEGNPTVVRQWSKVVEVAGEEQEEGTRKPPLAPTRFGALLDSGRLAFSNGADLEVVRELYRATAAAGFGELTALRFPYAGWGDAEVAELGAMLGEVPCPRVTTLDLSWNRELRSGEALGAVVGLLAPSLEVLDLSGCWALTSLPPQLGECAALEKLEKARPRRKVLLIPPDFTRYHSRAGLLTELAYEFYGDRIKDVMPALGTHAPLTEEQRAKMFGSVPASLFRVHDWRKDVVTIGKVPAEMVRAASDGRVDEAWPAQLNRLVWEGGHDLVLSLGQPGVSRVGHSASPRVRLQRLWPVTCTTMASNVRVSHSQHVRERK